MSTAFYPTNMRAMPAGGVNFNSTLQNMPYVPSKGTGVFSNPVGVTSTHIRPLTNMDPGNIFPTGFGLPRPIKHFRKGTVIPIHFNVLVPDPSEPSKYVEQSLIEYNVNRAVKSSLSSSLGGGNGGTGLISQLIDMPGSVIIKDNGNIYNNPAVGLMEEQPQTIHSDVNGKNIDKECTNCNGVGIVSSWKPITNLTEKPEPNVTNPLLCCNQQRKAYQRTLPTNTNISKNYYQTTKMYLYNRCQTFKQREFNFINGPINQNIVNLFLSYPFVTAKIIEYSKPGDPLSIANQYVAQCNPNFTVEIGAEIAFINSLSIELLNTGYISQLDYETLTGYSPLSIATFIQSLQSLLKQSEYKQVIDYLYQLAANPYNGSIVSGPSNPKGCSQVYYKPNNPQFAKQGGVSSSTRLLKLNVDTISSNAARQKKLRNTNFNSTLETSISYGGYGYKPSVPFIYKDKVPPCQAQTFIGNPFFFQGQHQNKLICRNNTDGAEYHTYNTVNGGSAGNYIGATQSGGSGYASQNQMPTSTYFNNIRNSGYRWQLFQ
jgi:hypothetical protein